MDPRSGSCAARPPRLPRTRGDGPRRGSPSRPPPMASPHTRGWTRHRRGRRRRRPGFPAHAGMDPTAGGARARATRLPRTRGDGPVPGSRVWMGRGASPHTRGWTAVDLRPRHVHLGFPAHAGMDPEEGDTQSDYPRLPRTRGDGPSTLVPPGLLCTASPHTRGWTLHGLTGGRGRAGFPAHAGMDRVSTAGGAARPRLPRTRGDGPERVIGPRAADLASPHTRGWTPDVQVKDGLYGGFPAHAGMDPMRTATAPGSRRLPRTRGDGPGRCGHGLVRPRASPHTRGWTWSMRSRTCPTAGFPAHAGMDP